MAKKSKLDTEVYEAELTRLQAELVEMQEWVKASGARIVVIFEGRDAAGKGGSIKRIAEATMEELCEAEGIGPALAKVIYDHYHSKHSAEETHA